MINRRESAADSASGSAGELIRETQDRLLPEGVAVINESGIPLENILVRYHKKPAGRISVEPGSKFSVHDDEPLKELSCRTSCFERARSLACPDKETDTVDAVPGDPSRDSTWMPNMSSRQFFQSGGALRSPPGRGSKNIKERYDMQS